MPQMRPGTRETVEHLKADLRELINEHAHNPAAVKKLAQRCIDRIIEDIEPKLEREAPAIKKQIDDLEARVIRLEQERVIILQQQRKEA